MLQFCLIFERNELGSNFKPKLDSLKFVEETEIGKNRSQVYIFHDNAFVTSVETSSCFMKYLFARRSTKANKVC